MGPSYNNNTQYYGRIWPHADDAQGMHYLYPATNVGRDLAMSRSKLGGNGKATDLGFVTPSTVCPGQMVSIEHTYENRGNESVSTNIRFYFSANRNITTSDMMSPSILNVNPPPYHTQTVTSSVQVPLGLSPGSYYVGAIIDPADTVTSEQDESYNNRLQVRVGLGFNEILTVNTCP